MDRSGRGAHAEAVGALTSGKTALQLTMRVRIPWVAVAACCALLALACSAGAQAPAPSQKDVYMVLLHGPPLVHYDGSLKDFPALPRGDDGRRPDMESEHAQRYKAYLIAKHDEVLEQTFAGDSDTSYTKLYSYHYVVNGFAALLSSDQAAALLRSRRVAWVERDRRVQKLTTYTPTYMGLPSGAWAASGGQEFAGEGVVIGLVDTGVNPAHPSFSDTWAPDRPYRFPPRFTGTCEVHPDFPPGSCNNKLVGARHFAAAVIASGIFNPRDDSASPLDGDGHGTHTASTAAGNSHVPVLIDGMDFGPASGIAPRAHLAVYKSMYRNVGGYFADTVAAIEQAAEDGVDVLSLSIGPADPPSGVATFFSAFDMAALSAVKAGVFVVQAAGNAGPFPGSVASFSPWIFTVGAAYHDRSYYNTLLLGNQQSFQGYGLSPATEGVRFYRLVLASDCLKERSASRFLDAESSSCQNPDAYDKKLVGGRILVCMYTSDFLAGGTATMRRLLHTADALSARGVIILADQTAVESAAFGPFPSALPAVLVPSLQDSTAVFVYCKRTAMRSSARILGGLQPTFSGRPTQVAFYSSRGPDLANDKREVAEIMKPDAMAPGNMIWAAWSPTGNDDQNFYGSNFALVSGTSMAAPHVAGIAALVKQKHPELSPAGIASALTTTASTVDDQGKPLLAQNPCYNVSLELGPATPFDFGGGEVNPTAALDPGLIFDAGFEDYVAFLCSIRGASSEVLNATGASCGAESTGAVDLNTPSLTVANLTSQRSFVRRVSMVPSSIHGEEEEEEEVYSVAIEEPEGVSVTVEPIRFAMTWQRGTSPRGQSLVITLAPKAGAWRRARTEHDAAAPVHVDDVVRARFGRIILLGSRGRHAARIQVSVING